ncbi:uncharacterized protein LOC111086075 [Limulus polyphemus]|uniref:Uncharacterized protein LOC111086075 n=1 Tax=Limulus polyphemus TaxID=6850 RepID=A0ABM1SHW3_LIMPO|nr:uncharacterized protein LOC111086075 [Limulus polyphemus]
MKPEIRACYGASAVGSVAGIFILLAGIVAMFSTVRAKTGSNEYDSMRFTVAIVTVGFLILLLGFAGCVIGFWWHLKEEKEAEPEPEPEKEEEPEKKNQFYVSPFHIAAPAPFVYASPTVFASVYPGSYLLPGQPDIVAPSVSESGAPPLEVEPKGPDEEKLESH